VELKGSINVFHGTINASKETLFLKLKR